MPNLTDDLGTAKERCLNQFGTAVSVWCGKSSTESVKLYLSSTHGTPSKSDVAPVSLHSTSSEAGLTDSPFKGGTSRKLLEGGGGGRRTKYQKNFPTPAPPPHNFCNGPFLNQNYVFHFLLMTKLPVREGNAL